MDADATKADVALMTSQVTSAGTDDGACGVWVSDAEKSGRARRRVPYLMTARLSSPGRSVQDEHSDISRNLIGAIFLAAMTRAVFCAVLDYSTTAAAGPEPKDDG